MLRVFVTLGSGEILARLLHVATFLFLARTLGKDALGQFGLMVTISSYLLLTVQQGFDVLAIRETSKCPNQVRRYAQGIIGLRLALAIGLFAFVAGYVLWGHPDHTAALLVMVFSARYVATAISPQWSALALGEPKSAAVAGVIAQAVFLGGAVLVRNPSHVVWAAMAQVSGEMLSSLYLWFWLSRRTGHLRPAVDAHFWRFLIRKAWPITGSALLGNLLFNFDVLALGWFSTRAEIGLYLACYRCVTVFSPLMALINNSVLPHLSRAYPDTRKAMQLAARVALPMLAGTVLAAFSLTLFAPAILRMLYGGAFGEGKAILQVIAWVLPIQALRNILRPLLVASHLETRDTLAMAVAVIANAGLDLLLAPVWGGFGCAISTVTSEMVLLTMVSLLAHRHLKPSRAVPFQPAAVPESAFQ